MNHTLAELVPRSFCTAEIIYRLTLFSGLSGADKFRKIICFPFMGLTSEAALKCELLVIHRMAFGYGVAQIVICL